MKFGYIIPWFVLGILSGYPFTVHGHDLITEIEAVHLAERLIPDGTTVEIKRFEEKGEPVYEIISRHGKTGFKSKVLARTARVLSIQKNDEPFYRWEGIKVVGHRGNVLYTPENTIPAFEKAIELGVDLIEIDVRETKDGQLVIMHDSTVDRTTNGSGAVKNMTLKEIKQLDAGSWFSPHFKDVRVPTLEEALDTMTDRVLPDIDFKAGTPQKLIQALQEHGLLGKVTLYCGNGELLARTRRLTRKLFWRPTIPNGLMGLPVLIGQFDPPIVNVDWQQFGERLVREIHLAGKKSFLNSMGHDTEWAILQMIDTYPDYIQTDHTDILLPLLRAKGLHR